MFYLKFQPYELGVHVDFIIFIKINEFLKTATGRNIYFANDD